MGCVAATLFLAIGPAALASESLADPDAAVESGAEALDRFWSSYEWYDETNDRLRPVKVRPPSRTDWFNFGGGGTSGGWGEFFQIVGWSLIVVFLAALAYLLIRVFLGREIGALSTTPATAAAATHSTLDRVEALPFEVRRPRSNLLEEARRNYEHGDYREAIIYLFSHLLVELDKFHVVRLNRGKTNRQYLAEVRRHGPPRRMLAETLHAAMIAFEDVYYGGYPLPQDRFEAVWQQLAPFQKHLESIHAQTPAS